MEELERLGSALNWLSEAAGMAKICTGVVLEWSSWNGQDLHWSGGVKLLEWQRFALEWYKSGAAGMAEICTGVVE